MTNELRRLAFLLAASDFSEKQMASLLTELANSSPEALVKLVRRLRAINEAVMDAGEVMRTAASQVRSYERPEEAVVNQIERLLRVEASMTINEAMQALGDSLRRERSVPVDVRDGNPKSNSEQFRRWLLRLLEYLPGPTLLHYATVIRNKRVHTSTTDWPLKEGPGEWP